MNAPAKRIRAALQRLGWSMVNLSEKTGYRLGTLRNIICGSSVSRRGRQVITDAIGVGLWDGLLPRTRRFRFDRGDQTEAVSLERAKQIAREFRGSVRRRGKLITFIHPKSLLLEEPGGRISEVVQDFGNIAK